MLRRSFLRTAITANDLGESPPPQVIYRHLAHCLQDENKASCREPLLSVSDCSSDSKPRLSFSALSFFMRLKSKTVSPLQICFMLEQGHDGLEGGGGERGILATPTPSTTTVKVLCVWQQTLRFKRDASAGEGLQQ